VSTLEAAQRDLSVNQHLRGKALCGIPVSLHQKSIRKILLGLKIPGIYVRLSLQASAASPLILGMKGFDGAEIRLRAASRGV